MAERRRSIEDSIENVLAAADQDRIARLQIDCSPTPAGVEDDGLKSPPQKPPQSPVRGQAEILRDVQWHVTTATETLMAVTESTTRLAYLS